MIGNAVKFFFWFVVPPLGGIRVCGAASRRDYEPKKSLTALGGFQSPGFSAANATALREETHATSTLRVDVVDKLQFYSLDKQKQPHALLSVGASQSRWRVRL